MSAANNPQARPALPQRRTGNRPFSLLWTNTSAETSPTEPKSPTKLGSPKRSANGHFFLTRKLTSTTTPIASPSSSSVSTPSPNDTVADLHFRIESLVTQLEAKTLEADYANSRARKAEEGRRRLKDMGERFWREEWSKMRDYMRVFSGDGPVTEIERMLVSEYGGLFVGGCDGVRLPTPSSSIPSLLAPARVESRERGGPAEKEDSVSEQRVSD